MTDTQTAPVRAVVVDDTEDLRLLLTIALEREGDVEVVGEAGNGRDGIEVVRRTQPDVVLLDLAMPVMDGLAALPQMRRDSPVSRIVVLSGFEADAMAERAMTEGACAYLQKGMAVRDILATVRALTGTTPPEPVETGETGVLVALPDEDREEAERLRLAISTTAHEIRNSVSVLRGAMDLVSPPTGDPRPMPSRLADAVTRQLVLLERVTEDLLTAARARKGLLRTDLGHVDCAEVVEAVLALHRDLDVVVSVAEGLAVRADPTRLLQIVSNLLSNAGKYGAPPLGIDAAADGDTVAVTVWDAGPGVPEEFRPRLFEEFTRAETSSGRGTGLGLFVVRTLAEAQGGTVEHRHRGGGGSLFTVRLPRAT